MYIEAMFKNERLCILFDANEEGWSGKQKRWSLAGAGHMDLNVFSHPVAFYSQQNGAKTLQKVKPFGAFMRVFAGCKYVTGRGGPSSCRSV